MRPVLGVLLVTSVVAGGAPNAAPKKKPVPPICNQIVDPKADATAGALSTSNEPSWDVVSADIAADAKMLTTVIRVDKLTKSTSADPLGSQWRFDFFVGETNLYTQATSTPFGDKFVVGYTDTTSHSLANSGATGVFDDVKNEVRVSVPLSAYVAQAKITPGTKLTQLAAQAGDYVNTAGGSPSGSFAADDAVGSKPYATGTATCVAVGK
jgi:hypothetical protein